MMSGLRKESFSFKYSFAKRETERLLLPRFSYSKEDQTDGCSAFGFCSSLYDKIIGLWKNLCSVPMRAWQIGKSYPRKIIFSAKMGLALILISLLVYFKEPFKDLSKYSVWAFLTVVVAFEFSVGATLSKGFSRGLGAVSAGGLALGLGELSQLAGNWGVIIAILGLIITGFCITYAKLHPAMKTYEYGFRVFLIMCCFIMVSGYRTREFISTAVTPLLLIALGACISLAVNICIYPIWAGEDLHNLVVKHFMAVATSLEGCVSAYIQCVEYERIPEKILTFEASDDPLYSGYRSAMESISQEDALVRFAVWEPPHGPYKMFKHPWRDYVKLSGSLRHCVIVLMALHGCILSEIQAPAEKRQVFRNELQRVGIESAKVLRLLGSKVKKMEKLGSCDILSDVHEAAEELQIKLNQKSYLFVNSESWEIGKPEQEIKVQQDFLDINDDENYFQDYESPSEIVMDIESVQLSRSLSDTNIDTNKIMFNRSARSLSDTNNIMFNRSAGFPPEIMVGKDISWEAGQWAEGYESKTYENGSGLSLASFSLLLIEFVARLQNLVDSFEELSEKAKFKEPANLQEDQVT